MSVVDASLILTVLNEEQSIRSFLDSITRQTATPAEIVVVDGGSSDLTVDRIREWDPPTGCSLLVLVSPGAGISKGRNIAIEASTHEHILVTDAGTHLDRRWVEIMSSALESSGSADVVGGFFYPVGSTLVERTIAFSVTPTLSEIDSEKFLPSSRSVAFSRAAWAMAGGYPEWLDYCEDIVFDLALKSAGCKFVFANDALVSWSARPTVRGFMKQYYRYARGDGKAGLWARRHAIRYVAYVMGLVLALLAPSSLLARATLALGTFLYLQKFWRRVFARRSQLGRSTLGALALVPVVVVAGDIAKMAGYPVGIGWRHCRGRQQ